MINTGACSQITVLVVDDEEGIRFGLKNLFEKKGYRVFTTGSPEKAKDIIQREHIHTAIIDVKLKVNDSGIQLMGELKTIDPDLVCILITGYGSIDTAVRAMKEGAADYILKPIDNENLISVLRRNLEISSLRTENRYLKEELLQSRYGEQFITKNPAMISLLGTADKVKDSDASVMISGESGTGKEVLAQYIHFTSGRKAHNFVGVNCAALSETLLLSELFGHERGAFTGAVGKKTGKFEMAHNGTLFLDEIGDMSRDIQAKLLRAIEESSFERVGGTKKIHVNLRIISATNKDLSTLIKAREFREDLFYRLNVVCLHLSPLRERPEDIHLLTRYFTEKYNSLYKKGSTSIPEDVLEALSAHSWPGNVRELKNVISQSVLLSEGPRLTLHCSSPFFPFGALHSTCRDTAERAAGTAQSAGRGTVHSVPSLSGEVKSVTENCERALIEETLQKTHWNKSETARLLGVTRKTLARKIEKYGIGRKYPAGHQEGSTHRVSSSMKDRSVLDT